MNKLDGKLMDFLQYLTNQKFYLNSLSLALIFLLVTTSSFAQHDWKKERLTRSEFINRMKAEKIANSNAAALESDGMNQNGIRKVAGGNYYPVTDINESFPGPKIEDYTFPENTFFYPSANPMGAVGQDNLISVVSNLIDSRSKTGELLWQEEFESFFSPLGIPDSLFSFSSPKILFDQFEDRFLVASILENSEQRGYMLLLAVSKTSNPLSPGAADWYFSKIDNFKMSDGGRASISDLNIGIDEEAIYITAFLWGVPYGLEDLLLIIDKGAASGLYSGGSIEFSAHNPRAVEGVTALGFINFVPARVQSEGGVTGNNGEIGTFLVTFGGLEFDGSQQLQIIRIDDPLGKNNGPYLDFQFVALGKIDGSQVNELPRAPQPEANPNSEYIISGSKDIYDCVWKDGILWAVTVVTPPEGVNKGQATVHWIKLDASTLPNSPITLLDQGNVGGEDLSPGTFTYYPSIAVNDNGDMQLNFSASSPTLFVGTYTTGRLADDPPGTTRPIEPIAKGNDFYHKFAIGGSSWGEYSSISIDPENNDQYWLFNAYSAERSEQTGFNDGRWETVWASISLADIAQTPNLIMGPVENDFEHAFIGDSKTIAVSIENYGGSELIINDINFPENPYSANLTELLGGGELPVSIPAQGSANIQLIFDPNSPGQFNDSLQIFSNDPDEPVKTISIAGSSSYINFAERRVQYSISGKFSERYLIKFDPETGNSETLSSFENYVGDLAVNSKGEIFGVSFGQYLSLTKIDPVTGTMSNFLKLETSIGAMDFGPDGLLYFIDMDIRTLEDNLFTLDTETNEVIRIGPVGSNIENLSFNPIDGTLWASGGDSRFVGEGRDRWDIIYTIDITTGKATELGMVDIISTEYWTGVDALGFDQNGNLYGTVAVAQGNYPFFKLNLETIEPEILWYVSFVPDFSFVTGFAEAKWLQKGSHLQVSEKEVNFGNTPFNWPGGIVVEVELSNFSEELVTINSISSPQEPFQIILDSLSSGSTLPISLPSYRTEIFHVAFEPQDTSFYTSNIIINSTDDDDPEYEIPLSGKGSAVKMNHAYAVVSFDDKTNGELHSLNLSNGRASYIGNTGLNGVSTIAINSIGEAYVSENNTSDIFRLNHVNAETQPTLSTETASIKAMAFNGGDSLFAVVDNQPDYSLYYIDLQNEESKFIADLNIDVSSIDVDPTDGSIWASADTTNSIYKINPRDGGVTLIGQSGLSTGEITGLMFDSEGNLYGSYNNVNPIIRSRFLTINKTDGIATIGGTMVIRGASDISARLHRNQFVVGVDEISQIPAEFELLSNYPNPFNPTTTIRYNLNENSYVKLNVYNVLGQLVKVLVDQDMKAGYNSVVWDGTNVSGNSVPSGIYIYSIEANNFKKARKMSLLK